MSKSIVSGKRKRAVARAVIKEGDGLRINKKGLNNFNSFEVLIIQEPMRIANEVLGGEKYDIDISVRGGGKSGQIEACRLAIARAILEHVKKQDSKKAESLKRAFTVYDRNLLIADTRRKETYKPGDSKARSKRQKSYR